MIKFYLYSSEYTDGKKLAEVCDMSSANVLKSYYKATYNTPNFLVTIKEPRQREIVVCGTYNKL